jgi:hypothetical protein
MAMLLACLHQQHCCQVAADSIALLVLTSWFCDASRTVMQQLPSCRATCSSAETPAGHSKQAQRSPIESLLLLYKLLCQ